MKYKEIIGIGTDIILIARVNDSIKKYKDKFIDKMFSFEEKAYCRKYDDSVSRFAGRFSAKEAIVKALGSGFGNKIGFLDISIINDEHGKPMVILSEEAKKQFLGVEVLISISHCKEYATATAIALRHS